MVSTDLRLALSPAATYDELLRERASSRWWEVLSRPALYALLVGALFAMEATGRVTIALALTVAISWSFTVLIQAAAGAVMIASAPQRPVSVGRAFELLFLGHAPWSLWLLATTLFRVVVQPFMPVSLLLSMLVPAAWTVVILAAFCRTVLRMTPRGARIRVVVHQAIIWGGFLLYVMFAAGGAARVLEVVGL